MRERILGSRTEVNKVLAYDRGSMPHLYAESFAPWCEKARWALDHHGIGYRYTEHVPLVGELGLRIAARRMTGLVTVPLLVTDDGVLMDSLAIAEWAERRGDGQPLFPEARQPAIDRWNEQSQQLMIAGRAMLLPRMAKHSGALREQLPPFVPGALRAPLRPLASSGVTFLMRKYGIRASDHAEHERRAREALDGLRAALPRSTASRHLIGDALTFADVAMATALQFVRPVDDRYIALGPATREAWTHPALAAEYEDLLGWRDALYARCRRSEA